MKHRKPNPGIFLACLTLAVIACACPFSLPWANPGDGGPGDGSGPDSAWQDDVEAVKAMTRTMEIPRPLLNEGDLSIEGLFDPNQLLEVLDHLSLRTGYTLGFVYANDGLGGYPILYARPTTQPPYPDVEAFEKAMAGCDGSAATSPCNYLNYVIADGTQQGYFQWVLLRMMGDQFYLFWHANYNDAEIIANQERLEALVETLNDDSFAFPLEALEVRKALNIDPTPVVAIGADTVTVRVVWFTKWGGFIESTYTLSREAPHEVLNIETEDLVPYDCGILF
jgi:hypothetical protein